MKQTSYKHFLAAFRTLIKEKGWGAQRRLAEFTGKTPVHISDVLGERKRASQELQESIAGFFGLAYEDMLARGRDILVAQGTEPEPKPSLPFWPKLERLPSWSEARATVIYEEVANALGLLDLSIYTGSTSRQGHAFEGWNLYLAHEIDEEGLYEVAKVELGKTAKRTLNHLKRLEQLGLLPPGDPEDDM
jgi:transcriptional regulator with XRE-family HTH domain